MSTRTEVIAIVLVVVGACTWLCFALSPNREGTMSEPMTEQELRPQFKYELGSKVRCRISGFEGVVTGQHRYLYGCLTYTVKPVELKDGKPIDAVGFDEGQLELVPVEPLPHTPIRTGGPCPSVPAPSR